MNKIVIAALFSSALIASPSWADGYLGAGGGVTDTNSHENTWKVYGGLQFSPNWGVELGYNDLGSNTESWSLAGTGVIELSQDWSLIGKLGVASNHLKADNAGHHNDLYAAAGVGYAFTKNIGMRLEYENFGKLTSNNNSERSRASDVLLSLKYSF